MGLCREEWMLEKTKNERKIQKKTATAPQTSLKKCVPLPSTGGGGGVPAKNRSVTLKQPVTLPPPRGGVGLPVSNHLTPAPNWKGSPPPPGLSQGSRESLGECQPTAVDEALFSCGLEHEIPQHRKTELCQDIWLDKLNGGLSNFEDLSLSNLVFKNIFLCWMFALLCLCS